MKNNLIPLVVGLAVGLAISFIVWTIHLSVTYDRDFSGEYVPVRMGR